jgi:hypothetical protein
MAGRIDYVGKVYVYSSGMSKEIISLSKEKLGEYGVNEDDIVLISQRVFLKDRLWSLSGHIISQWQRLNGSEKAPFMHRSYSTSIFNSMVLNSRMEKS